MPEDQADAITNPIELATELTVARLSNPNVRATADEVPAFLRKMHEAIGELAKAPSADAETAAPEYVPAVPVRSSVKSDYIVSLIDGRKMKSLKRHLKIHGLTPKEYRERYGLKPDYPMVAPGYSAHRREVAQRLGLGRKRGESGPGNRAPAPETPAAATSDTQAEASKPARRVAKPNAEAASPPVAKTPRTKRAKPEVAAVE